MVDEKLKEWKKIKKEEMDIEFTYYDYIVIPPKAEIRLEELDKRIHELERLPEIRRFERQRLEKIDEAVKKHREKFLEAGRTCSTRSFDVEDFKKCIGKMAKEKKIEI